MSVRKRTWKNAKGKQKECWIVDYVDQHGEPRFSRGGPPFFCLC